VKQSSELLLSGLLRTYGARNDESLDACTGNSYCDSY